MSVYEEFEDACGILVPLPIGSTELLSVTSNGVPLPEDPNLQWDPNATYAAGDRRYLASTHRVYESVKDGNLGKDPSLPMNQYNAAGVATWWIDVGPTNLYAAFDGTVSTPTIAAGPLVYTIRAGAHNTIAMFGLDADSLAIEDATDLGGDVFYSYDAPLEATAPDDYYEYFFSPFKPQTQFLATDIEPYGSSVLKITLTGSTVKVGMIAVGDLRPAGIPQRDASVEPQDFSYVKQDAFGNTEVKKRANATGMSITTKMDIEDARGVLDTIKEVLGVPVVVVGSKAQYYEWMTVFGLLSARMSPADFPYVTLSATVRGLI